MVYEKDIKGDFVTLRSITVDDAEFSYELRKDPRYVNILGQPAASLDAQIGFIRWQIDEPGDYYFVVYNRKNERIGLIGVYGIHDGQGETGREINTGAPYETMEAQVLLLDFVNEVLGLRVVTSVIYKENKKNISASKKSGCHVVGETIRSGRESWMLETKVEDLLEASKRKREIIPHIWA